MNKTPIQELIKYIHDFYNKHIFDSSRVWITPEEKATELLEKEKKIIIDANTAGWVQGMEMCFSEDKSGIKEGEDYFNKTFNNEGNKTI